VPFNRHWAISTPQFVAVELLVELRAFKQNCVALVCFFPILNRHIEIMHRKGANFDFLWSIGGVVSFFIYLRLK